jgi:chromatin modification-related protein VID21
LGYQLLASKLKIGAKPLNSVFPTANKTLSTKDWKMAHEEVRFLNILEQVEGLKAANLWPYKQLKPQVHPPRPKVLWDYLLEEMEWLAEDFKQERVWKKEAARNVASWVMDWHNTSDKSLVCVITKPIVHITEVPQLREIDSVNRSTIEPTMSNDTERTTPALKQEVFKAPLPVDPKLSQVDPKTMDVYVNSFTNMYMLKDNNPLQKTMAHIPAFEKPKYAVTDMYIESSEKIVPVSKFMNADYVVKDINRFDTYGKLIDHTSSSAPVKRLGALKMYEEDNEVPSVLFENTENEELHQPHSAQPDSPRPVGSWTSDEEDALWNLAKTFSYNWQLITETINATRLGNGKVLRTEWCCFNKYNELKEKQFTPHSKGDYLFTSNQTNKKEKKVKVLGMLSTFNYISSLAKKRDAARAPRKKK